MVTLMLNVSSELGDGEMVRLLSEKSMEICDRFSDVIEDVVTSRMQDWDSCVVRCDFVEAFQTLRKVLTLVSTFVGSDG